MLNQFCNSLSFLKTGYKFGSWAAGSKKTIIWHGWGEEARPKHHHQLTRALYKACECREEEPCWLPEGHQLQQSHMPRAGPEILQGLGSWWPIQLWGAEGRLVLGSWWHVHIWRADGRFRLGELRAGSDLGSWGQAGYGELRAGSDLGSWGQGAGFGELSEPTGQGAVGAVGSGRTKSMGCSIHPHTLQSPWSTQTLLGECWHPKPVRGCPSQLQVTQSQVKHELSHSPGLQKAVVPGAGGSLRLQTSQGSWFSAPKECPPSLCAINTNLFVQYLRRVPCLPFWGPSQLLQGVTAFLAAVVAV